MRTNRRTLLGTIAGVAVLAGCLGDINEENPDSDERGDDESTDASDDESREEEGAGEGEETDGEGNVTGEGSEESMAEDGDDDETADESVTEEEIIDLVESILDEEGLVVETIGRRDGTLEVVYIATGTTSDAVRTEIEILADVYVRAINSGLSTDRLEAFVQDPEGEDILDSFGIETEWVTAYTNEEIGWDEYVERIVETFE